MHSSLCFVCAEFWCYKTTALERNVVFVADIGSVNDCYDIKNQLENYLEFRQSIRLILIARGRVFRLVSRQGCRLFEH